MENNVSNSDLDIDGSLYVYSLANQWKVSYAAAFEFVSSTQFFVKTINFKLIIEIEIYSSVKVCLLEIQ